MEKKNWRFLPIKAPPPPLDIRVQLATFLELRGLGSPVWFSLLREAKEPPKDLLNEMRALIQLAAHPCNVSEAFATRAGQNSCWSFEIVTQLLLEW